MFGHVFCIILPCSLAPHKCGYQPKPNNRPSDLPTIANQTTDLVELSEFKCDFEIDVCNYANQTTKTTGGDQVLFVRKRASLYAERAPKLDHTFHKANFYYLQLETAVAKKFLVTGSFGTRQPISPYMLQNDTTFYEVCVDFWYYMDGDADNWLKVATRGKNGSVSEVLQLEGKNAIRLDF